eukprot:gnl/TRDRNA2_/TRDRNA2_88562_c0_seq1.p1 gnl/TRDRNA2_/TRDRNA2_88562_c0~~gnl/TRDRNA2_/TRDRNA2_88562_c0_seq1.p1  ORF type:complete len:289 (+),score=63.92 gnl/TRDRNA2_/TRDRNA2_88562_c0_seq1:47-913(+)
MSLTAFIYVATWTAAPDHSSTCSLAAAANISAMETSSNESTAPSGASSTELNQAGSAAFHAGDFLEAQTLFTHALDMLLCGGQVALVSTDDLKVRHEIAVILVNRAKASIAIGKDLKTATFSNAIFDAQQAVRLDKRYVKANQVLVEVLQLEGRLKDAYQAAADGLMVAPTDRYLIEVVNRLEDDPVIEDDDDDWELWEHHEEDKARYFGEKEKLTRVFEEIEELNNGMEKLDISDPELAVQPIDNRTEYVIAGAVFFVVASMGIARIRIPHKPVQGLQETLMLARAL